MLFRSGLGDAESKIAAAKASPLPPGPTAWPVQEEEAEGSAEGDGGSETATSGEEA